MCITGFLVFFFFKQKTAYELRISDWSSDVCSSDLLTDISQAIGGENVLMPGGQLSVDGMKRSLSVNGEYADATEISNTVIGSIQGGKRSEERRVGKE